ncbi:aspartate/glutamate racemase family protein [Ruegeria sp. MALMAid1280]|uniref:aspartate/glutamate racemase family protein n=1 Tax=Ruegeria sp. MALMAid1280 TaxID=3411634 RepID=UPI003BA3B2C8
MSRKIGLIGGLGWPATVAYYEAICRAAKLDGHKGSPEMAIESLDMSVTVAARGVAGDEKSWSRFDEIFRQALGRLSAAGCDCAAIASVTPHNRLDAIARDTPLPVISVVDAVTDRVRPGTHSKAIVLGTSVTMNGNLFDDGLAEVGVTTIQPNKNDVTGMTSLLEDFFYTGRAIEGRNSLIAFIRSIVADQRSVLIILACTDLTPAFPESVGQARFTANGFDFLDATAAHVAAILKAAEIEFSDQPVSKRM